MTDYPYAGTLVADPITFQRAANAMITVYDANDTTNSAPLALKDTTGLPMANPVKSTGDAFIPAMLCPTEGRKLVGGGLTVIEFSHTGIKDAAVAAADAAQEAADSAATAAANTLSSATVDGAGQLVVTKASGETVNAGNVKGPKGDAGLPGPQGPAGISNIALDTDGTPYFAAGSNAVQILADSDGQPYYV